MSTSGSYTPPTTPECPYAPRMTRAAALALRTAGGLLENCVVVITDAPVIGTAGNTSPTEVELNPVSPTELGTTARVHTTFAASAWPGVYDIDLGAAGTITELRDDWGNTAKDIDSGGATVHTQFPWHLGSATMRDNYVEDSTLLGWDTQVGALINNRVVGSTVDLTGKTGGVVQDNVFQGVGLVLGAGGASANLSRNRLYGVTPAVVTVNHTGTGALTFSDVTQQDGFLVALSGTAALSISDSTLSNHGSASADITLAGAGSIFIGDSEIIAPGNAVLLIESQAGTTGSLSITRSTVNGTRLAKLAGSSGPLSVSEAILIDSTVTVGAANAASTNSIANAYIESSTLSLLGPIAAPGRNDITTGVRFSNSSITVAATATAGVGVQGGTYENANGIVQNRTAGTGSTTLFACHMRGFSTFTDNGTTDPGVGTSFSRLELVDSTITVGNLTGKTLTGTVLQQADLMGAALTLTGPNGLAFLNRLRLWGASLANAGFDGSDLIIDGAFTKTMTAAQSNRLCNKGFDDWI